MMPEHPIAPPASGGVSVCPGAAEACQEVAATLRAGGSALIGVAASGERRCCCRRRRRRFLQWDFSCGATLTHVLRSRHLAAPPPLLSQARLGH